MTQSTTLLMVLFAVLVCTSVTIAGTIREDDDLWWVSNGTPLDELVPNNDDYTGPFQDSPNRISVNSANFFNEGKFRQDINSMERMVPVVASGGTTEYALTLGGGFSPEDAGFQMDFPFELTLGFGTRMNFVRAAEVAPNLRFDTSQSVSPAIGDFILGGPFTDPLLTFVRHEPDRLIFQGTSRSGGFSEVSFSSPEMLLLPLDVPDLPLSVRDFYSQAELVGFNGNDRPFVIRMIAVPEPNSFVLLLSSLLGTFMLSAWHHVRANSLRTRREPAATLRIRQVETKQHGQISTSRKPVRCSRFNLATNVKIDRRTA